MHTLEAFIWTLFGNCHSYRLITVHLLFHGKWGKSSAHAEILMRKMDEVTVQYILRIFHFWLALRYVDKFYYC